MDERKFEEWLRKRRNVGPRLVPDGYMRREDAAGLIGVSLEELGVLVNLGVLRLHEEKRRVRHFVRKDDVSNYLRSVVEATTENICRWSGNPLRRIVWMPKRGTKAMRLAVASKHSGPNWIVVKECRFANRKVDVLAKSIDGDVIAYELKSGPGDFTSELRDPEKRGAVMPYCSQFYFVCPSGAINPSDVPKECGLIYCDRMLQLSVMVEAPRRTPRSISQQIADEIHEMCDLVKHEFIKRLENADLVLSGGN